MVLKDTKNAIIRKKAASDLSTLEKSSKVTRGKKGLPAKIEPILVLDPQLSRQQPALQTLRAEKQCGTTSDAALRHRSHIPRMQLWPTPARLRSDQVSLPFSAPPSQSRMATTSAFDPTPHNTDYHDSVSSSPVESVYPDPSMSMEEPYLAQSSRTSSFGGYYKDEPEVDPLTDEHLPEIYEDEVGGNSKLKGVFWPGMAIFDSASPDAKRKRNQKKDGSILEQMEHNAAIVEPIELIFTPHGDLKKRRTISGRVEDSSPIKEETPKPKRCRPKPKAFVLSELSTNNPRETRGKRALKTATRRTRTQHHDFGNLSRRELAALDSLPGITSTNTEGRHFFPTTDEEIEWRLTFGEPKRDRKRAIAVYDDTIDHQPQMPAHLNGRAQAYPFLQPTGYNQHGVPYTQDMPLLTSSFHPTTHMMGHSNTEGASTSRAPNVAHHRPVPGYLGKKENKENIVPIMDRTGHIDNGAGSVNAERRTQRYFSVESSHTPQFFHTLPSHMEFGTFQDSDFYGHSFNPLTLNFQQQTSTAYRHSSPPFTRRQTRAPAGPSRRTTKRDALAVEPTGQGYLRGDAGEETEDDNERMLFDDEAGWSS